MVNQCTTVRVDHDEENRDVVAQHEREHTNRLNFGLRSLSAISLPTRPLSSHLSFNLRERSKSTTHVHVPPLLRSSSTGTLTEEKVRHGLGWQASHAFATIYGVLSRNRSGSLERFGGYDLQLKLQYDKEEPQTLNMLLKFRSPEQALNTLRTAIRCSIPALRADDFNLLHSKLRAEQSELDESRWVYEPPYFTRDEAQCEDTIVWTLRVVPVASDGARCGPAH
ncbi:hypothetical protein JKP88DRAFT_273444 [Tribonema minus]|uniref:Uncharacterized protein n=1 Tax=Tribonema minus TaxID=303371 RepID=A0A836CDQ6_9STRA|nr:hypothetical protein JKP88DRAFT_273444 [Tribonema minus]